MTARQVWRALAPVRGPLLVLAAAWLAHVGFAALAGDRGLLTPGAPPSPALVAVGLAALLLRLVALAVVPAVLANRGAAAATRWALARWARRRAAPADHGAGRSANG